MIRLLLFAGACVAVPFFGFSVVAAIDEAAAAEPGILAAAGALVLTVEMVVFSLLGIPWRPLTLAIAPAAASALAVGRAWLRRRTQAGRSFLLLQPWGFLLALMGALLVLYAAVSASATSIDFVYFWGPKAQRFAAHRGIDFAFLAAPENHLLHPDYPPLVSLLSAWTVLVAGSFSWWGPILLTPLLVGLSGWSMWRLARRSADPRLASEIAGLLVILLGYGLVATSSLGNAEALLVCWEVQALSLLTFRTESGRNDVLASMMLTAAVLTKVEGAAFAALGAVVFAFSEGEFRWRRFRRLAILPLAALSGWVMISRARGISHAYALANPYGPFTLVHAREVVLGIVRDAGYGIPYVPWIALAGLFALSPRPAAGLRHVALAGGYGLFIVFCYLHGADDPRDWILVSAPRLLLTPLTVLLIGAAAAWAEPSASPAPRITPRLGEE